MCGFPFLCIIICISYENTAMQSLEFDENQSFENFE